MHNAPTVMHLLGGTNIGGIEMLALSIAKSSHGEFVFIANKAGILSQEFNDSPCPFYVVNRRFFFDPYYIYKLHKISKKHSLRILHAHQLLSCLNAWFLSLFTGQKVYLSYHGFHCFSKNIIVSLIGVFVSKRMKQNIFVSTYLKEYYEKKYKLSPARNTVLYNGISFHNESIYDKLSLREEFNIPKTTRVLGMTGNFCLERDHIGVCKAFYFLLKNEVFNPLPHLIFIGRKDTGKSSKYQEAYRFCKQNNLLNYIHFAGPRKDASKLLHNFDVFVYASHLETFCLSMVEAIIAGIPVIINDFPVLKEISLDGKLANLYRSGNVDDMYEKIRDVLTCLSQQKKQAQKNKSIAANLYNIKKHKENLLRIYQEYS